MILSKHMSAHVTLQFKSSHLTRNPSKSFPWLRRPCRVWSQAVPPAVYLDLLFPLPLIPWGVLTVLQMFWALPWLRTLYLLVPLSGMLPPGIHGVSSLPVTRLHQLSPLQGSLLWPHILLHHLPPLTLLSSWDLSASWNVIVLLA